MSEPARNCDARAGAQEALDAILREAMAMRNSGRPVNDFVEASGPTERSGAVLAGTRTGDGSPPPGAPGDGVKFDRFDIKVAEPGLNRLPTYTINSHVPVVAVLGTIAFALWILVPGGIQLLRAQPIPDTFVDASARWTLALTRQRIESFRQQQGRLPQSLEELDPNLSEVVTYQGVPGGGFVLRAPGHRQMFTLKSEMSQERFLARSTAQLRQVTEAPR